jgi:hypothetical protein
MTMETEKIYRSKRHADDVAQRVGAFIEKNGIRETDELVEAARPKNSPIHNDFDWNPDNAMDLYLRRQANSYLRFIRVYPNNNGQREVHAFYAIKTVDEEDDEPKAKFIYYTHEEVKSNEDRKEKLSQVYYKKLLAYCKNAEDIGLDKSSETWKRLIRFIMKNAP